MAINVKHLQPDTVRIYLSDLKLAHSLKNKNTEAFDDFFLKKMLKGADHLKMYADIKNRTRYKKKLGIFPTKRPIVD